MSVKITETEHKITAFLDGEIDHHSAAGIRMEIDEAVGRIRPDVLKLDYGKVTFMDSSGVGLVMGRYREVSSYGGRLIVSNLSPQIYKIMLLAGLQKIAVIDKKEDENHENNK